LEKYQTKFRIKSNRLTSWDYTTAWWYYVTINTFNHKEYFGKIKNGKMELNEIGKIAEEELGIKCEVLMPPKGVVDQKRMMETLLAKGVDGVAVSPIDAENQTPFLNEVAKNTILITQDADAPMSDRLVYIGANNYKAGRALGQLVKDAIPEGGEVMLLKAFIAI